jgi:hypothetical protein
MGRREDLACLPSFFATLPFPIPDRVFDFVRRVRLGLLVQSFVSQKRCGVNPLPRLVGEDDEKSRDVNCVDCGGGVRGAGGVCVESNRESAARRGVGSAVPDRNGTYCVFPGDGEGIRVAVSAR